MKYYLHNDLKDGMKSIFMQISLGTDQIVTPSGKVKYKGKRFRYYTGTNVLPKYWDAKNQRVRTDFPDSARINKHLQDLKSRWLDLKLTSHREGAALSIIQLQKAFKKGNQKEKKMNLMDALAQYIQLNRKVLEYGTIKNFTTLENDLKEFTKESRYLVDFDTINDVFKLKFIGYLYETKGNTDNTVAKMIEKLKTLLNWATKMGYNKNTDYKAFKTPQREKTIIYLQEDELKTVEQKDFSKTPNLEKVRDMFCFACHTGLRHSDVLTLAPEHIQERKDKEGKIFYELNKDMWKVKKRINFKLDDYAVAMIKKYKSEGKIIFPELSNQQYNVAIKEVAKAAELNTMIQITEYKGSERESHTFPKHELISSHVARHTFGVLSIRKGMQLTTLKELLGHSDIETTMGYLRVDKNDRNSAIDKYWNE